MTKKEWIDYQTTMKYGRIKYPINEKILSEIYNLTEGSDAIIEYYTNGHCYDFAKLLKSKFPQLTIIWHRFYGHLLVKDENDILYDANGFYDIAINKSDFPTATILDWMIKDFSHEEFSFYDLTANQFGLYNWYLNHPVYRNLSFFWVVSRLYQIIFNLTKQEKYHAAFDYDELVPDLVARVWNAHPEITDHLLYVLV